MASRARRSDRRPPREALTRALGRLLPVALPEFLPGRRWFGAKGRCLAAVGVVDVGLLGPQPTDPWLTVVEVTFLTGPAELYAVPVVLRAREPAPGRAIGRLDVGRPPPGVYDALDDPEACRRLLAAFTTDAAFPTEHGLVRFARTSAFPAMPPAGPRLARRLTAEQSNTSVVYDETLHLKAFRRLQWGVNPDCEVTGFLTTRTAFRQIPRLVGSLEYTGLGGCGATLAMLQHYVPNQGDGWTFCLDHLSRLRGLARDRPETDGGDAGRAAELVREFAAGAFGALRRLGERTGELHAALASSDADPAFAPEPLSSADVTSWIAAVGAQAERALAGLRERVGDLAPPDRAAAEQVLVRAGPVDQRAVALRALAADGCVKIRTHGDYHLGQTLRTQDDFVIFDFEGEPARPLAERRAKQCPLRDVAGMLRSLDYAVASACRVAAGGDAVVEARLPRWGAIWRGAAIEAFLAGYRAEAARSPARLAPASPARAAAALRVYELDKAFYELAYELDNRPAWVPIPLRGLTRLLAEDAPSPR